MIYLRNGALSDDDTSLLKGMKSRPFTNYVGIGQTTAFNNSTNTYRRAKCHTAQVRNVARAKRPLSKISIAISGIKYVRAIGRVHGGAWWRAESVGLRGEADSMWVGRSVELPGSGGSLQCVRGMTVDGTCRTQSARSFLIIWLVNPKHHSVRGLPWRRVGAHRRAGASL